MKTKTSKSELILICATTFITLGVTPFYSYDPINVFRFALILIFGFMSISLIVIHRNSIILRNNRTLLIISIFFIFWNLVVLIKSDRGFTDGLLGITGRHTGFLTYMGLTFVMILAAKEAKKSLISYLNITLLVCGAVSAIYGVIQYLKLDPFDWINPYSPVFGVFGNPNFQASFLGISATAALAYSLQKNRPGLYRIVLLSFIPVTLFVIYQSKSQQGFLVFAAGSSVVIYLWLKSNIKLSKLAPVYIFSWGISILLVLVDILQKSPWSPILYKPSVTFRGDFWRTGWNITTDNPIFGKGLDSYNDYYRLYRDRVTAERNPTAMVDSAHNVFLDISSGGGFPLLIIYCALILLVLISILKVIRREKEFNAGFAGIAGAWIAYFAQSIISINQIGLAVWGWVLSGIIIGYEVNTRKDITGIDLIKKPIQEKLAITFGLLLGLAISLPLIITDGQFRSTIKAGDVISIEQNLDQWPQSVMRMNLAAQIFIDGGFADRALIISKNAVELKPRNFEAWEKIYLNPTVDDNTKSQALLKMRELDPFNPNLK